MVDQTRTEALYMLGLFALVFAGVFVGTCLAYVIAPVYYRLRGKRGGA